MSREFDMGAILCYNDAILGDGAGGNAPKVYCPSAPIIREQKQGGNSHEIQSQRMD